MENVHGALVDIFEIVNETRGEIFIGLVGQPEGVVDVLEHPPAEISHWRPSDDIDARSVAYTMPMDDARKFLEIYLTKVDRPGWKVRVTDKTGLACPLGATAPDPRRAASS